MIAWELFKCAIGEPTYDSSANSFIEVAIVTLILIADGPKNIDKEITLSKYCKSFVLARGLTSNSRL